jgi:hypothetical protein
MVIGLGMLVVLAEIVNEDSTFLRVIYIGDSVALVAGASSLARLLSRGLGFRLGNRNRDRVDLRGASGSFANGGLRDNWLGDYRLGNWNTRNLESGKKRARG